MIRGFKNLGPNIVRGIRLSCCFIRAARLITVALMTRDFPFFGRKPADAKTDCNCPSIPVLRGWKIWQVMPLACLMMAGTVYGMYGPDRPVLGAPRQGNMVSSPTLSVPHGGGNDNAYHQAPGATNGMPAGGNFAVTNSTADHGLSLWNLFLQADWVVKSVIISLVLASMWSWAIMIGKQMMLMRLNRTAYAMVNSFSPAILDGPDLRTGMGCPFAQLVRLTQGEWRRMKIVPDVAKRTMALHRLQTLLNVTIEEKASQVGGQLSVLASMSSTAPFIALFGTVWGIMNSFQAIALSKNTSLAVVAPGIAEALFATAIGFLVAIPASLGYNRFSVAVHDYTQRLSNFSQELLAACMRSE